MNPRANHEAALFDSLPVATLITDREGKIRRANVAARNLLGDRTQSLEGRPLHSVLAPAEANAEGEATLSTLSSEAKSRMLIRHPHGETTVEARTAPMEGELCICLIEESGPVPRTDTATLELLTCLAENRDIDTCLIEALSFFQQLTGCEASGLRLREGNDFPYFATSGLSDDFIANESKLCARTACGAIRRRADGSPVHECMCGAVIDAHTDPTKPYFTDGGSFWTNSTTGLVGKIEPPDPEAELRFRCHHEGFESVALIPLRGDDEIFGLIQLNDTRRNVFSDDSIALLESLSRHIASVLD